VHFVAVYFGFLMGAKGVQYLRTKLAALEGATDVTPKRSTKKEFYDVIIFRFAFAWDNLPVTQTIRGLYQPVLDGRYCHYKVKRNLPDCRRSSIVVQ
jgi:hypothetical protein